MEATQGSSSGLLETEVILSPGGDALIFEALGVRFTQIDLVCFVMQQHLWAPC
jgi:hypothetical protein